MNALRVPVVLDMIIKVEYAFFPWDCRRKLLEDVMRYGTARVI